MDRPIIQLFVKYLRLYWLLLQYLYLHLRKLQLYIQYYMLKAAGAALIEAVKIEFYFKALSKYDRIMLATIVAVSIYSLALVFIFRT